MSANRKQQRALVALLRQIRVEAGFTQVEMALALGKPQSFVSKYESGERRLDLLELRQLCTVLRISLINLVRRFERAVQ